MRTGGTAQALFRGHVKNINDTVKMISGIGLVIIALIVLAMFMIDYNSAQQQVAAAAQQR